MKNKIYLVATLFIGALSFSNSNQLIAQDSTGVSAKPKPETRNFAGRKTTDLSALYGIPVGAFGSQNIENGGFAAPGWGFAFDSRSYIGRSVFFTSKSTYQWIDLDAQALGNAFTAGVSAVAPGTEVTIEDGTHRPFFTTLGLGFEYPLTDKIRISLLGGAGIMYNSFKPFKLEMYLPGNNNPYLTDYLEFDSDFSFAWRAGTEITLFISKSFGIILGADYSRGHMETVLRSQQFGASEAISDLEMLNIKMGLTFLKD